jgi:hypothetical protein
MTHVTVDHAVERVQFAYPQIYYACHTRHRVRAIDGLALLAGACLRPHTPHRRTR